MHNIELRIWFALAVVLLETGCNEPLFGSTATLEFEAEGGHELSQLPAVVRLRVRGGHALPLEDLRLISGEISSVSEGKLRRREEPDSLIDRRLPLASYREGNDLVLAPSVILEPGESYSVAVLGVGVLGDLTVVDDEPSVLYRWGDGSLPPAGVAHYCAALPPTQSWVGSNEGAIEKDLEMDAPFAPGVDGVGFGSEICIQLLVDDSLGDFYIPPPHLDGWLLDPSPISLAREKPSSDLSEPPECTGEQLLQTCVSVVPAGFQIDLGSGGYLLQVEPRIEQGNRQAIWRLVSAESPRIQHIGPLLPDTSYRVTIASLSGIASDAGSLMIKSGQAESRLVLTELQPDPFGSEPANEWVEIFNAGSAPASLAGLSIWDDAAGVPLPELDLSPGAFGLIVRADFAPDAVHLPNALALPIVVDSIGQNGLRNSGEVVRLVNAEGIVLSEIPALSVPEGVSVARMEPWSSDGISDFMVHPEPGLSPGLPNPLE